MRQRIDLRVFGRADQFAQLAQPRCVGAILRALRRGFDESCAFQGFGCEIGYTGGELGRKLMLPAAKSIDPAFDGVFVGRFVVQRDHALPPIILHRRHGRFVPASLADNPPFQGRCHNIVAVLVNIRFDNQIVTDNALDRETPAVDQRLQILDNNSGKRPKHGP